MERGVRAENRYQILKEKKEKMRQREGEKNKDSAGPHVRQKDGRDRCEK